MCEICGSEHANYVLRRSVDEFDEQEKQIVICLECRDLFFSPFC